MDINSTTAVATTSTNETTQVSSQNTSKSETSFKDEMKEISENTQETEKEATTKTTTETEKEATTKTTTEKEVKTQKATEDAAKQETPVNNEVANDEAKKEIIKSAQITKTEVIENNNLNDQLNYFSFATNEQQNEFLANNINSNIGQSINQNITNLLEANKQLESLAQTTQLSAKIDYTSMQMDENDAKFFVDLTQNTESTLQNVMTELQQGTQEQVKDVQKNVQVSQTLLNNLAEAAKTNQPLRINFDKDVSVILKVDKDGALSATFIPGDKAVEEYLKQNISFLRQNFDNQGLNYKELSYKQQNQQRENNNRKNNKENEHE